MDTRYVTPDPVIVRRRASGRASFDRAWLTRSAPAVHRREQRRCAHLRRRARRGCATPAPDRSAGHMRREVRGRERPQEPRELSVIMPEDGTAYFLEPVGGHPRGTHNPVAPMLAAGYRKERRRPIGLCACDNCSRFVMEWYGGMERFPVFVHFHASIIDGTMMI